MAKDWAKNQETRLIKMGLIALKFRQINACDISKQVAVSKKTCQLLWIGFKSWKIKY